MSTGTSCEWQAQAATASERWIRVPSTIQNGERTVSFTVSSASEVPLVGLPRTGEVRANSRNSSAEQWRSVLSISIEQTGPTCTYTLSSPSSQIFNASGGDGQFQ